MALEDSLGTGWWERLQWRWSLLLTHPARPEGLLGARQAWNEDLVVSSLYHADSEAVPVGRRTQDCAWLPSSLLDMSTLLSNPA